MGKYEYVPLFPEGKQKAFTMSYDDGNDCDIRLTEIMRRYGIRGTFNLNSGLMPETPPEPNGAPWRRMTMEECLQTYGDDMEIAVHGAKHPWWNLLASNVAAADILDDRRALERATGKLIRGAAYPFGTWNDDVVSILRLAGIRYCRTTKNTGVFRFPAARGEDPDFLLWHPTTRNTDPKMEELGQKFLAQKAGEYLWLFYLWGHSYEFVRDQSWDRIEAFLAEMGGHEEIWYATNIEIVDYYDALRQLRCDTAGGFLTNPTDTDVWVRHQNGGDVRTLRIPAGQSVSLPL